MTDDETTPFEITRRTVLTASGTAVVGLTAFTGSAAAHEVSTIAFCGCTQVSVYGEWLLGRDYEEISEPYYAVLYCDGDIKRRELTGSGTRLNYDMDADDTIGPNDDCQIIALEGQTYDAENKSTSFTICNKYCPSNCASKGLNDQEALDSADVESCDDPGSIWSGGSFDGVDRQVITIQCSGCGRDDPGHPGQGRGKSRGRGP